MDEPRIDNRSDLFKKFMRIATEVVTPLREASDKGQPLTPHLIGEVQGRIQKVIEQVHYGFHPDLEQ